MRMMMMLIRRGWPIARLLYRVHMLLVLSRDRTDRQQDMTVRGQPEGSSTVPERHQRAQDAEHGADTCWGSTGAQVCKLIDGDKNQVDVQEDEHGDGGDG